MTQPAPGADGGRAAAPSVAGPGADPGSPRTGCSTTRASTRSGIQRIVAESAVTRVTLYRHFPSKDDLISAYLERRAPYDHDQVDGIIDAHPDDPRRALTELATALTRDDFAAMQTRLPLHQRLRRVHRSPPRPGARARRSGAG